MTTLNPSHNPFRKPSGRHAQAIHQQDSNLDEKRPGDRDLGDKEIDYPDIHDIHGSAAEESAEAKRRGRREGRRRVRAVAPPVPDLRFEQSYLLSIRPFLTPAREKKSAQGRGEIDTENADSGTLVSGTEDDAVFHWGRAVNVDWKMVAYVTFRDQLFSPLWQGALWGWGTLFLASTGALIRSSLYPASHIPKGRFTGGAGGKLDQAGGGEAVGGIWWRNFVRSWGGALETATV